MFNVKEVRPVATAQIDPATIVPADYSLSYFVNIAVKTTISLLLALLTVENYFPNIFINIFGLISLSIFIYFVTIRKNDYLGFVFLIFILAHFNYASNQGGTINFAALFVLLIAIVRGKYKFVKDQPLLAAVGLILIFNFAGYYLNPTAPFAEVAKGATAFIAYILVFIFCNSLRFRLDNIGSLLVVLMFISLYSMAIALNYNWSIYVTDNQIPFLTPDTVRFGSRTGTNMIGNSELYGEECLMLLAFCLPILLSLKYIKSVYKSHWLIITLLVVASLVGLLLSRSRSVVFLITLLTLLLPFLLALAGFNMRIILRNIIITIVLLIGTVFALWTIVNMDYSLERLNEIENSQFTVGGIISGEKINRGILFQYGYDRLRNEPWKFGFGWLTHNYNMQNAVGQYSILRSDLHSLYLTLPLYFGWVGAVAFLSLFLITLKRLWSVIRRNQLYQGAWRIAALCFFLSIILFLLNEFKIGILREPHYFMTIWIWLGLANSLYWSCKEENAVFQIEETKLR